jgi:hypothetical protein
MTDLIDRRSNSTCEIGILDRKLLERRGPAAGESVIEGAHLMHEHPQGPTVADDVVQGQDQDVVALSQANQERPHQGRVAEVERPPRLADGQLPGALLPAFGRDRAQVEDRNPPGHGR